MKNTVCVVFVHDILNDQECVFVYASKPTRERVVSDYVYGNDNLSSEGYEEILNTVSLIFSIQDVLDV